MLVYRSDRIAKSQKKRYNESKGGVSMTEPILDSVIICSNFNQFQTWLHNVRQANDFYDYYFIFILYTSGANILIDDKLYEAQKGDIVISSSMEYYKVIAPNEDQYQSAVLIFNPAYVKFAETSQTELTDCFQTRTENFSHLRSLTKEQIATVNSYIHEIERGGNPTQYGDQVLMRVALIELLLLIHMIYQEPGEIRHNSSSISHQKIHPILDYINANLDQKLSLDRIAQQFFMSKYHLCRIFKASTGRTVNEYINFRRVLKACELLREGAPLTQACEAVHMENTSHFIATFKKIIGTTPKQYAKRFANNQ